MRDWIIIGMGLKDVPVYLLSLLHFSFQNCSFPGQMFLSEFHFSKWFKFLTSNSVNNFSVIFPLYMPGLQWLDKQDLFKQGFQPGQIM